MRADRLLSLLLLLQTRGRLSARKLALELEVSERTIYRDIDALSAAGVPVFGQPGRHGGYELLGSYRTDLTGLTEGEARALFMLQSAEPLVALGMGSDLRSAILKLSAALPDSHRQDERRVRQRFHLDWRRWEKVSEAVPHLPLIQQAVWEDRCLEVTYELLPGLNIQQRIEPYGLVAQGGVWHVVCFAAGRVRVFPVSAIREVEPSTAAFQRQEGFELVAFWEEWCAERERSQSHYLVTVRVAPSFVRELPRYFGEAVRGRMAGAAPPDAEGWIRLELAFQGLEAARERLLGFGRAVEVLKPEALRRSMLDYARQIASLYVDQA